MKRTFFVVLASLAMLSVSSCKGGQKPQDGVGADGEMVDSVSVEIEEAEVAKPVRHEGIMMDLRDSKMEKAEDVLQKAAAHSHEADKGDLH